LQLVALRRLIDALLAESAAKEAAFFTCVEGKLVQPPPEPNSKPGEVSQKPADAIPWENLIDYSR
jgi:hypothetical protein